MPKFGDLDELVDPEDVTDDDLIVVESGGDTYRVTLETLKQFILGA